MRRAPEPRDLRETGCRSRAARPQCQCPKTGCRSRTGSRLQSQTEDGVPLTGAPSPSSDGEVLLTRATSTAGAHPGNLRAASRAGLTLPRQPRAAVRNHIGLELARLFMSAPARTVRVHGRKRGKPRSFEDCCLYLVTATLPLLQAFGLLLGTSRN